MPRTVMAQATRRISASADTISGQEERSSSSSPLVTSLAAASPPPESFPPECSAC